MDRTVIYNDIMGLCGAMMCGAREEPGDEENRK
jgi:hypothetical protein